ncbi:OmpA family protein [Bacteroidota bacterium]
MKYILLFLSLFLILHSNSYCQKQIFNFNVKKHKVRKDTAKLKPKVLEKKQTDLIKKRSTIIDPNLVLMDDLQENEDLFFEIFNIVLSEKNDSVHLFCTIENSKGKKVANMAPPYNSDYKNIWKEIIETIEGKEYPIKEFEVKEFRQDKAPSFITSFVLDFSGSMFGQTQYIEVAMEKVKKFVRINKDEFDIVQFDHRIFNPVKLSGDTSDLTRLIPFSQLGCLTAFYNASFEGMSNIKKSKKTRIAILFTDGLDNQSFINAYDVIVKARELGIRLFVIGYGSVLVDVLTQIAAQTGGKAFFPKSLSELDSIFTEIYRAMNVYYVISYKIPKPICNKHDVTIKTNIEGCNCSPTTTRYYLLKPIPFEETRIYHFALFKAGSAVVEDIFLPNLLKLADYMKNNPGKKISIYGHTDSGGDSFNQKDISLRRAHAVYNILARNGMDVDQVVNIDGYGFEKPIHKDDKDFEWKRRENRRVEIIFEN